MRNSYIGGSDIATVLGHNWFGNDKQLIARKLGLSRMDKNLNMMWGIFLEPIHHRILEQIENIKIIEVNCFRKECFVYSPDGIFEKNGHTYLLETKCPITWYPNYQLF